jgi:hypothetical protein
VIAGGGIGDGAIDGVVNLYIIDDATRMPVSGATVRVGAIDGTTDATGLFVADGVVGPQQVAVKATNYRSELWLGANGANMTCDLKPLIDPVPTSANLSGQITGFDALTVPAGHIKGAIVSYSQLETLPDGANNIKTANKTNECYTNLPGHACNFTITTRTGTVGLVAVILDIASVTPLSFQIIGWAYRTGITVENGINQTGMNLAMIDPTTLGNVSVSFGNPPTSLSTVIGVVGIDAGAAAGGTFQLPLPLTPAQTSMLAPKLAVFNGSTYRLTMLASDNATPATVSAVVARNMTAAQLSGMSWLAPPTGASLTHRGGSWNAVSGALVQSATYTQTVSGTVNNLLSVTAFDGSTTFTVPDMLALPSGTLQGTANALAGSFDLTNFSGDADFTKVTGFSVEPATVN